MARQEPRSPDVLHALALHLALWSMGRRTVLRRALQLARRILALNPGLPGAHALLGFIHFELGRPAEAAASFTRAWQLKPDDREYENCLLRSLLDSHQDEEFLRLLPRIARRHRIDLEKTRRELEEAGMPSDPATTYLNSFPVAFNWIKSRLWDEAEAVQKKLAPARHRREKERELAHARASRRANRVSARKLPPELRPLAPLARKWGIGDDADRGLLMSRMTRAERTALRKALPVAMRRRIDAWLRTFPDAGKMPQEAVALMYLLEAFEEL